MTAIRGIIFDKDGTLFDFAGTWESWARSFLHRIARDGTHAAEIGNAIGFDLRTRQFEKNSLVIAGTPGEVADELLCHVSDVTRDSLIDILNEEAKRAPQIETVPLAAFLSALRLEGFLLGLVTNDAVEPAMAHLAAAGIEEHFDFIAGFDSGHGAKPDPGQLIAFQTATGLEPEQIVMVGDSTHDLIAGRRAAMRCVGVLTGLADTEDLLPHADAVLENIGALPSWLAQQAR